MNNHLASLSAFTTWVQTQAPRLFPVGNPAKGIGELGLPPLEPRALSPDQVRSLKNLYDRLPRFHQRTDCRLARRRDEAPVPLHAFGRPWRDWAIVAVLLSTGLRREELVRLDLDQLLPQTAAALRTARQARISRVLGKGKTERTVFLSADARGALADYLDQERGRDADALSAALFLSAAGSRPGHRTAASRPVPSIGYSPRIGRCCAKALARGTRLFYRRLTADLDAEQRRQLDRLLLPREESRTLPLTWLRQPPGEARARTILSHLDRLQALRAIGLPADLERAVHQSRLTPLAREGAQMSAQHLRDLEERRRYATLVAVLLRHVRLCGSAGGFPALPDTPCQRRAGHTHCR